jgi:hypothetical protein
MNKQELKTFIDDFFRAWKEGDEEKVPTFYDKNVKAYSDFKPISLEDILNRFEFAKRKFVDLNHGIKDLFIDEAEGKIAIRMEQNLALREDLNKVISCKVISLYKVVNYKITEIWMSFYPNIDYLDNR